jgi:hypothetical protein
MIRTIKSEYLFRVISKARKLGYVCDILGSYVDKNNVVTHSVQFIKV